MFPRSTPWWLSALVLVVAGPGNLGAAPRPPARPPGRTDRLGDPLPPGAVARLGAVRLWHWASPVSLAFSRDGKSLAAQTGSGDVLLWATTNGRLRYRLPTTGTVLNAIALLPGGSALAIGDRDGQVRLVDVATGKTTRFLRVAGARAHCVACSPDGKLIAVGLETSRAGAIAIWDRSSAKPVRRIEVPGGVFCLAFSPDGKTLASGGFRAGLRLWDAATGKEIRAIADAGQAVRSVAFSRDGKILLTTSPPLVQCWDVATGEERLLDPAGHGGLCAVFSPGGKWLAWAGSEGKLHLIETSTGREVHRFAAHPRPIVALAFSADGKTLATGSVDQTVRLWDVASGKDVCPLPGRRHPPRCLAYHPDGKRLAAGGWGGVTFWDVARSREVRYFPLQVKDRPQRIVAVAFSPDGTRLAAGADGGILTVWDVSTGKELHRLAGAARHLGRLVFSPDGKTIIATAPGDPSLWMWDVAGGKRPREVRRAVAPGSLPAWSPDGKVVAVGSADFPYTVRLWERRSGKELPALLGHSNRVDRLLFSADGGRLLSDCRADRSLRVWDLGDGQMLSRWMDNGLGQPALAFSPDGTTLASCAFPGPIRILEAATGRELCSFEGHHLPVRDVVFSPDGRTLASAGEDTTILVWDVTGLLRDPRLPDRPLTPDEVAALWDDLESDAPPAAHHAVWRLAAAADQAVPYLQRHLRPVPVLTAARLGALIRDLDADKYSVRLRAARALEALHERAEPALRKTLRSKPPLEVRRRVEELLRKADKPRPAFTPDELRGLRAVRVLGLVGTPAARRLLRDLTRGDPESPITREARACLRGLPRP